LAASGRYGITGWNDLWPREPERASEGVERIVGKQRKSAEIRFKIAGTPMRASMLSLGDGGLIWIETEPTSKRTMCFTELSDDFSFEGLRLQLFSIANTPDVRVVFAEYYQQSWVYARIYLVRTTNVTEVLTFSHRDPDSVQLLTDRMGNLKEIRFRDRWTGHVGIPEKYTHDPGIGLRWCLETRYKPTELPAWKPKSSRWLAVPF